MDETPTHAPGAPTRLRDASRRLPRWWPLPLCIGIGLAGGLGYGLATPPQYSATSYVIVVPQHSDPATALGFAQAYGRVITGSTVLADAQEDAGVPLARLRENVQVATSPDAPMIAITGTGSRARDASDIANAVANSLTATGNRNAANTGVRLLMFSPAAVPAAAASPSTALSGAVGASAGGLVGALVLLVRPGNRGRRAAAHAAVPAPAHGSRPSVKEMA
ncbi:lipopolysaccharide biosynthesis protein [Streptomyces sp. SID13666]|uniref:lipopolysaccharide biosynthesis protein n=1 Tax=unclassified Streptomyces TaxID=2593676 RepID=UPI0013C062AD|nr:MULTISPECIES: lipopolysaccharide biosynthesis protein [unclassified Streptomyces]NEA58497.1 lipopolysaccharide biosynthesis protein [Streptomyces sp. SID13666]NEA72515.1 lipopolysaccharide biosynthesis protein [Streptomyces sp. SID13588]